MRSVKSKEKCESKVVYPYIMEVISSGAVLLMSSETQGTIVHQSGGSSKVGRHVFDVVPHLVRPYNGSVCLEN